VNPKHETRNPEPETRNTNEKDEYMKLQKLKTLLALVAVCLMAVTA
jgi:hypothetical protein